MTDAGEPKRPIETTAVTAGRDASGDSLAPVLYPSTTYQVESLEAHRRDGSRPRSTKYYSRFGSPTVRDFEDLVAELEGAEAALAGASGMATLSSVLMTFCSSGDHIVATRQLFSVTVALLQFHLSRFGIETTFVDGTDAGAIAAAVRPGRTQIVLVETPANPSLSLVDLDAVGAIAGPVTVVDSTFAGPAVQRPLDHGADLVLHAATKGIAGHNDALLGVIAGSAELIDAVWGFQAVAGGQASPFDAWNGIRGARTLPARVRQQSETALAVARALEDHPNIDRVSYPYLDSHPQHALAKRQMRNGGTVVAFEVSGGEPAVQAFVERLRLARIALSLGGPETLVTHPATVAARMTPAERADIGITDGLIRLSVGLEHADDVIADLTQALG